MNHLLIVKSFTLALALAAIFTAKSCGRINHNHPSSEADLSGTVWQSLGNGAVLNVGENDSLVVVYNFTIEFINDSVLNILVDVLQNDNGFSLLSSTTEEHPYHLEGDTGGYYTIQIPDMQSHELYDYRQHFTYHILDSTLYLNFIDLPNLYPGLSEIVLKKYTTPQK